MFLEGTMWLNAGHCQDASFLFCMVGSWMLVVQLLSCVWLFVTLWTAAGFPVHRLSCSPVHMCLGYLK